MSPEIAPTLPDHRPMPALAARRDASGFEWLSFPAVLMAGLIVVAVFSVSTRFNDPDLWFHLRLGKMIWESGAIPHQDTLSFTAFGHPWVAHEWLAQLGIYASYVAGGNTGLMLWLAATTSVLLLVVYQLSYRCCGNAMASFLTSVCVWFFSTTGLAIRPMLAGNLFLATELLLLELGRRNRRYLWALPALFAIWVNCHGSYYFGIGALAAHWICGWRDREGSLPVWTLVTSCAALCCNPVGPKLLWYPLDTMLNQRTNLNVVEEWFAPGLDSARGIGFLLAVLLVVAGCLLRPSLIKLREAAVLAMAAVLASQHFRMLFVFGIALAPVAARLLAEHVGQDRTRRHPVANALLISICAIATVLVFPSKADLDAQARNGNPAAAVEYIRLNGLTGPMVNDYAFGGYLLWALPEQKVFIDGRADVFDWTGVLREFGRWATLSEDPQRMLNDRNIRLCLLRKDAPMAHVMPYLPGWRLAYSDSVASVFVR